MPLQPLPPDPEPTDADLAPYFVVPTMGRSFAEAYWRDDMVEKNPDAFVVHCPPRALDYDAYRSSPLWSDIRGRVLRAAKNRCAACIRKSEATQVHHRDYRPRVMAGQDIGPLIALCRSCHYRIHHDGKNLRTDWREVERELAVLVARKDADVAAKRQASAARRKGNARRVTAHHEAGHAVIGRVLGLTCGHATIVPDHDSSGHAITGDPWDTVAAWDARGKYRDGASALRGRILTFMAGAEAERELLRRRPVGDGEDRRQINFMLDDLLPSDADLIAYEARFRAKCRWLIHWHEAAIRRVAKALMVHGHLSCDQLDALVKNPRPYAGGGEQSARNFTGS